MVEFALIFPVFLILTIGVVDLARIFSSYIAVVDGVREAALFAGESAGNSVKWCDPAALNAVQCPTGWTVADESSDPDNIAFQLKSTGIDTAEIEMSAPICVPDPCVGGVSTVTIGASYRAPLLTPILSTILGGSIEMSVTTTAKVLQ